MKLSNLISHLMLPIGLATIATACTSSHDSSADQINTSLGDTATNQIINGAEITPNQPLSRHIVAIYNPSARSTCTGTLLQNNIVLTAAHCVDANPKKQWIVFKTNFSGLTSNETRQVLSAVVSPLWKRNEHLVKSQGDVALVKFYGTIPKGYQAASLLPDPRLLKKGLPVIIAGYGISNLVTKKGTGVLRQATVSIANDKFSETELTIDQSRGYGACIGDSGGPAFVFVNGSYYVWGIANRDHSDSNSDDGMCNTQGVYASVNIYAKWINSNLR
ncbi:MAG: trypsin-like serine protease [Bdellovibrionota bacterium]